MSRALPNINYKPISISFYQAQIIIHWENGQSISYPLDQVCMYFWDEHMVTVNGDFFILWHFHNDTHLCTFCPPMLWTYLSQNIFNSPNVSSVEFPRGIDPGMKLHYVRHFYQNGHNY